MRGRAVLEPTQVSSQYGASPHLNVWYNSLSRAPGRRDYSATPSGCSAHLVAHLAALPPCLAPKARDDVPRFAHFLEARQEGFDSL
jgi:hypothetical protein